jgi:hypothetical protein
MFKKNQEVTVISIWSRGEPGAGSADYRKVQLSIDDAVVHSCGKQQMILRSEADTYKGKFFRPQVEQYSVERVLPRMSHEEAVAVAEQLANQFVDREIAQLVNQIERTRDQSEAFRNSLANKLAHYQSRPINPARTLSELKAEVVGRFR